MTTFTEDRVLAGWADPVRLNRKQASQLIPTWQLGTEQNPDDDLKNFASDGYRGNSLIFSCITEIAGAFAQLPPVTRETRDGEIIPDAPVTQLLNNPSPSMDGYEFQTTMATHKKASGNVYIEKVRELAPGTPTDFVVARRAMPVKALGLIRPDYVKIIPGPRRADDEFAVIIDGTERRRLPRADVIHIQDNPDPLNDFYGVSSIALIITESNLDVQMSKFELAFYQNAGVPYGMLKTSRAMDDDELRETRSRFRRAFQGAKKWFELLIINSSEATYEQLGLPQNQMEQPESREVTESRICAVFHVPPIIVGALVGLKRSTYANYETALLSFWSETMTNEKQSVASALTRELLPEFRTSPTEVVDYDMGRVKVLQSDNTDKANAVANLVRSGGFSPVQALEVVGLDVPEGVSEELISQNRETVVEREGAERSLFRTLDRPIHVRGRWNDAATLKGHAFIDERRRELEVIAAAAERDVGTYLKDLGKRFAAEIEQANAIFAGHNGESTTLLKQVGPEEEQLLSETLFPHGRNAVESGWRLASLEAGIESVFGLDNPTISRLLRDTSGRITAITETTRNEVGRFLLDAQSESRTIFQIVQGDATHPPLAEIGPFSQVRARMIARTEVGIAQNQASAARWRTSGLVEEVDISDGVDCGWTSHDDGDFADGTRRTLGDYEAFPSSHPNCVRGASAVIK